MTQSNAITRAAKQLVTARRDRTLISGLDDGLAPATLDDAYAVQDAILDQIGAVGGWKVAPKPDDDPRCSVIPKAWILPTGSKMRLPPGGEVEVETAIVLAHDLPPNPTEAQVLAAIGTVALAIEVLGSSFADRRKQPTLDPIADLQSNAAVIVAPGIADWRYLDLGALDFALAQDGVPMIGPQRHAGLSDALPCLIWLATHAAQRGHPLTAGTVIITGARLGPLPVSAGKVTASSPILGETSVHFAR